eukprot:m.153304 g.153304  ORF g.153304 m.153304 type:complete len:103 (-) comp24584_c0_seq3:269-577(-)
MSLSVCLTCSLSLTHTHPRTFSFAAPQGNQRRATRIFRAALLPSGAELYGLDHHSKSKFVTKEAEVFTDLLFFSPAPFINFLAWDQRVNPYWDRHLLVETCW